MELWYAAVSAHRVRISYTQHIFIIVNAFVAVYPMANKWLNIDLSAIIENTINNSMAQCYLIQCGKKLCM